MAKLQIFEFTVEGSGVFPFDMLRYDECWPQFESEIGTMAPHPRSLVIADRRKVHMLGISEPTVDRWRSFGWNVVPDLTGKQFRIR